MAGCTGWQVLAYGEAALICFGVGLGFFLAWKFKRLMKAQRQIQQAELEAEKQKLESVMNMAHDIRTLINVILGSQQLLELYLKSSGTLERERLIRHVGIIRENADRLYGLIGSLLEKSKQASYCNHLRFIEHNMVEIVDGIVKSLQDYAESRGLTLYFSAASKEILLACDRGKIEAVVLNLLSNAIKYTKAGGTVTVCISTSSGRAVLSVKDTGVGIPVSEQQRVFERYVRLHDREVGPAGGSGIGLCAVKTIVEQHGGNISVKSEYGKGSEFIVELPVKNNDLIMGRIGI